jgi:hypothetical protein
LATAPTASAETVPTRPPLESLDPLQRLYQQAAARYASIDSYIARLRRREQVNGRDKPEELLLFKFRKEPWSVYFKWLGKEGAGREVVYVRGRYGNSIHTLLAAGDMPFSPAGKHIALAPDNMFVRSASRHTISEAGIGNMVERFGRLVAAGEKDNFARLKYLGTASRPEYDHPLEGVEQIVSPGQDPHLPQGGRRYWYFDPMNQLPVFLITVDHTGHEVEYYCYDRLQYPAKLDDADFDPGRLWPATKPTQ